MRISPSSNMDVQLSIPSYDVQLVSSSRQEAFPLLLLARLAGAEAQ
jgi:hypothetical protein